MFYFHPIRSKEPPIFNFPTLDSAKYVYKMAAIAGPSCDEMGINSQNKNCRVSLEYITKYLVGKIGLCERQHFRRCNNLHLCAESIHETEASSGSRRGLYKRLLVINYNVLWMKC